MHSLRARKVTTLKGIPNVVLQDGKARGDCKPEECDEFVRALGLCPPTQQPRHFDSPARPAVALGSVVIGIESDMRGRFTMCSGFD